MPRPQRCPPHRVCRDSGWLIRKVSQSVSQSGGFTGQTSRAETAEANQNARREGGGKWDETGKNGREQAVRDGGNDGLGQRTGVMRLHAGGKMEERGRERALYLRVIRGRAIRTCHADQNGLTVIKTCQTVRNGLTALQTVTVYGRTTDLHCQVLYQCGTCNVCSGRPPERVIAANERVG